MLHYSRGLQVWPPMPFRLVMGMADAIANHGFFPANFANPRHGVTSEEIFTFWIVYGILQLRPLRIAQFLELCNHAEAWQVDHTPFGEFESGLLPCSEHKFKCF